MRELTPESMDKLKEKLDAVKELEKESDELKSKDKEHKARLEAAVLDLVNSFIPTPGSKKRMMEILMSTDNKEDFMEKALLFMKGSDYGIADEAKKELALEAYEEIQNHKNCIPGFDLTTNVKILKQNDILQDFWSACTRDPLPQPIIDHFNTLSSDDRILQMKSYFDSIVRSFSLAREEIFKQRVAALLTYTGYENLKSIEKIVEALHYDIHTAALRNAEGGISFFGLHQLTQSRVLEKFCKCLEGQLSPEQVTELFSDGAAPRKVSRSPSFTELIASADPKDRSLER